MILRIIKSMIICGIIMPVMAMLWIIPISWFTRDINYFYIILMIGYISGVFGIYEELKEKK